MRINYCNTYYICHIYMNSDLAIYKQNRINDLQKSYNTSLARLKSVLNENITTIQKLRQLSTFKQSNINNLINQYNIAVNALNTALAKNIQNIQNFTPKPLPMTTNNNKSALLIGINYTGTQYELYGCINDTKAIKDRITQNGFSNVTMLTDLTSKPATKANILSEFKRLLINATAGDLLFLLYSGHGTYQRDRNNDEKTGYDQCIVPCDFNIIVDDDLKTIIQTYLKPNVTLFAMFDSCYSGSVLDLKYQYMDSLNFDKYTENDKELETKGDVFMISGCTDNQTSADANFDNTANGALTWSLLEALKEQPNCTWRELVKKMRDLLKTSNFEQIPQFSSGTFENIDTSIFI